MSLKCCVEICCMFQKTNKHSAVGGQQVILNPTEGKDHVISHLQQLYKNVNKASEESNNEALTADSGPALRSNLTSVGT